ncbi:hypothetical protein NBT05_12710 [Aquimarina sp. ERC-38]|uniref:hypothetical protein n=1 Tax=Aquimarina sp. ERC-38 TaxID=2949996 RepID=UPI00224796CB|nr:hypothetical protein [Aquimarina sp. ERC-38]UZO79810.1 hypothetical protein NBT05_12710 [Aquimarina sp. ERC-38]
MENKDRYLKALINHNGSLNEIDLGEKLGLNEEETRALIAQLLSEHKIRYKVHRFCNYIVRKTTVRKKILIN